MSTSQKNRNLRKSHKWLTLIVGVQLMLWLISGLYMVLMDIDFIHGDHLVDESSLVIDQRQPLISMTDILALYPTAHQIQLLPTALSPIYRVNVTQTTYYVSARTGRLLPQINQSQAMAIATRLYTGSMKQAQARLLTDSTPAEIGTSRLPLWQINLNDSLNSRLYVSANSGQLLAKRHDYWRLFDIMWMLHIMDYVERDNIHNLWLRLFSLLALLTAVSGLALLWVAFKRGDKEVS